VKKNEYIKYPWLFNNIHTIFSTNSTKNTQNSSKTKKKPINLTEISAFSSNSDFLSVKKPFFNDKNTKFFEPKNAKIPREYLDKKRVSLPNHIVEAFPLKTHENLVFRHAQGFKNQENKDFFSHMFRLFLKNKIFINYQKNNLKFLQNQRKSILNSLEFPKIIKEISYFPMNSPYYHEEFNDELSVLKIKDIILKKNMIDLKTYEEIIKKYHEKLQESPIKTIENPSQKALKIITICPEILDNHQKFLHEEVFIVNILEKVKNLGIKSLHQTEISLFKEILSKRNSQIEQIKLLKFEDLQENVKKNRKFTTFTDLFPSEIHETSKKSSFIRKSPEKKALSYGNINFCDNFEAFDEKADFSKEIHKGIEGKLAKMRNKSNRIKPLTMIYGEFDKKNDSIQLEELNFRLESAKKQLIERLDLVQIKEEIEQMNIVLGLKTKKKKNLNNSLKKSLFSDLENQEKTLKINEKTIKIDEKTREINEKTREINEKTKEIFKEKTIEILKEKTTEILKEKTIEIYCEKTKEIVENQVKSDKTWLNFKKPLNLPKKPLNFKEKTINSLENTPNNREIDRKIKEIIVEEEKLPRNMLNSIKKGSTTKIHRFSTIKDHRNSEELINNIQSFQIKNPVFQEDSKKIEEKIVNFNEKKEENKEKNEKIEEKNGNFNEIQENKRDSMENLKTKNENMKKESIEIFIKPKKITEKLQIITQKPDEISKKPIKNPIKTLKKGKKSKEFSQEIFKETLFLNEKSPNSAYSSQKKQSENQLKSLFNMKEAGSVESSEILRNLKKNSIFSNKFSLVKKKKRQKSEEKYEKYEKNEENEGKYEKYEENEGKIEKNEENKGKIEKNEIKFEKFEENARKNEKKTNSKDLIFKNTVDELKDKVIEQNEEETEDLDQLLLRDMASLDKKALRIQQYRMKSNGNLQIPSFESFSPKFRGN